MPTRSASDPQVVIDVPRRIAVGITTDFSVAFKPGSLAGTTVTARSEFPTGDYTAWWYDGSSWNEYTGDGSYGPEAGFPLQDATSYFRVRFNTPMSGTFKVAMVDMASGDTLAQDSVTVYAVVGETADEMNVRIAAGGTITFETDMAGTLQIGNDVVIDGNGHTLHGNIVLAGTGDTVPYSVTVQNLIMRDEDGDATRSKGYAIIGQNQTADDPVKPVELVVRECCISRYERKGVYLTNARAFTMTGCTVGDVATDAMDTPNTYGDYAVDLNLCGVQGSRVRIVGNTFTGSCGAIGAIKVTQRGGVGLTDDVNDDILNLVSASIASCVIGGNDFSDMNASLSEGVANVVIGDNTNADGTCRTYCEAFPCTVSSLGTTYLNVRGTSDADMTFTMGDGAAITLSSFPTDAGTWSMVLSADGAVELTGTLREGASFDPEVEWEAPDRGPCGVGMSGFRRLILRSSAVTYRTGGISLPYRFRPVAVVANAVGGVDGYWDDERGTVVLCRGGAEVEDCTSLSNLVLLMFGH